MMCWSKNLLFAGEKKVKFTIQPTPTTATVKINGQSVKEITVKAGTAISWNVSASGYYSQSGSEVVNEDTVKNIKLSSRTTKIAVGAAAKNITGTNYYHYRDITFKYAFKKGRSYKIEYTLAVAATSSLNIITTTAIPSGTSLSSVDLVYESGFGTKVNTGAYSKTFKATADAQYVYFNLITTDTSYANLSGNVTITDNG